MVNMMMPQLSEIADFDGETPVVQLKYVDTNGGGLWVTWRWEHALDKPRVWGIQPQLIAGALAAFEQASPNPRGGETVDAALRRAWGVWGDLKQEKRLSTALASSLLPGGLGNELNHFLLRGQRPHVRIQPSPALGSVPWEALRVDEGERMVHCSDVSILLPASLRNAPHRAAATSGSRTVRVVNPVIPGRVPNLGSVLREGEPLLEEALGYSERPHVSREKLRADLADAARLFYVGHVTTGAYGLDTRLHLTDGPEARGAAEVIAGLHKPLTAADLIDGGWGIPERVALLACASGGETGFADPVGLVAALTLRGAELVTSARWTLPTDVGLEWLQAQGLSGSATRSSAPFSAFAEMIVAVDEAHASADPVAALNEWQRSRADAWEHSGDPAYSPLTWGALTTAQA
ncbi:CHAT domain-containing protein [Microbacterium sorbitolivorans]|uniref:CHAT domain-containing protein n=1 Tax=Microbacterium sorbitolivorans TaxID=1867410 RepID=A0A367XZ26_9MICO|nr:CHAT domain-containing protein [Microbacterium sorbitolivorans]RCK58659.1 CHAT domain-containing protein [Microbacterium sorbitolivorans]GGF38262.1 CHAT domain-containing protein [Microbacterium sorbitolivorans]